EQRILHRDDDDEGPQDERQAAERAGRVEVADGLVEGRVDVERAGPDVAVDDAERGQRCQRLCAKALIFLWVCRRQGSSRSHRVPLANATLAANVPAAAAVRAPFANAEQVAPPVR